VKPPLKIRKHAESVAITDALGRPIFLYFENDQTRRSAMHRYTEEEAIALARRVARLLTDDEMNR
jgi:transposase